MQVVIGRITRAHGLRGEVGVDVRTDEPERRFAPGSSVLCGSQTLVVASVRWHGTKLLVRFEQVPDRTAAEQLSGQVLHAEVDTAELPDDPEEYYDHQLIGLQVVQSGRRVGTVTGVLHLPHQDTLTIDVDGHEVLVPFVAELVPGVDLVEGIVSVTDQVAGLLDPDAADVVRP